MNEYIRYLRIQIKLKNYESIIRTNLTILTLNQLQISNDILPTLFPFWHLHTRFRFTEKMT